MWKRTLKTVYGSIESVQKSTEFLPEKQVYDALESVKYTVEYLPSGREWQRERSGNGNA